MSQSGRTVGLFLLIASLHLFVNGVRLSHSELWLDEASTYWLAASPAAQIPAKAAEFHSQPPLYYLLLHGVISIDDSEWAVRGLSWLFSLLFVAFVMFGARRLTLGARTILSLCFVLLEFGSMYARETRPYSLSALTSFAATLAFVDALEDPRSTRSGLIYGSFAIATLYSLAFDVAVVLIHGLFFLFTFARQARRDGLAAAFDRNKRLALVLGGVAILYLPYLVTVAKWQSSIGHPSLIGSLREALDPGNPARAAYRFAGSLWIALAMTLGWVVALIRREKLIWISLALFLGQVAFVHGFMHGRASFNSRYLMPAFPIFCLASALGLDWLFSHARRLVWPVIIVVLVVTDVLAAVWFVTGLREAPPRLKWRKLYAAVEQLPGRKAVFFDVGWVGQPFAYIARKDPSVVPLLQQGRGWLSGGSPLDRAYVDETLAKMKADTDCFLYVITIERTEVEGPYQPAFVSAMRQWGYPQTLRLAHPDDGGDSWDARGFCKPK